MVDERTPRVAVVTGAGRGIGESIARLLRDDGYDVLSVDRAFGSGGGGRRVDVDLADPSAASRIAEAAGPTVDLLVNAAAIRPAGAAVDVTRDDWIRCLDVNVVAASLLMAALAPRLRDHHASIINIASAAAFGKSGLSVYGASKAALISASTTAALEFAARGIRVNVVLPGTTETEMLTLARATGTGTPDRTSPRNIGGRTLDPDEVARDIISLASLRLVTGAVIPVGLLPSEW